MALIAAAPDAKALSRWERMMNGGGDMLEHTAFCIHPGGPPELAHAGLRDHAAAINARLQALSAGAPSKAHPDSPEGLSLPAYDAGLAASRA